MRFLLVIVFAVLASALPVSADPPDGMEWGPRRGPETPGDPDQPAQPAATEPAAADDPVSRDIAALKSWPDRLGVRAAESLLLRESGETLPRLLDLLSAEPRPEQPGAAWVVGRIGEPVHVPALLRAAARRSNGSRAEVFFEAAYDLDAEKTRDWLFSFLTLRRPVFRQKAVDFLALHVEESDHTRILRLLDAPKGDVRIAGLRLLVPAGVADAEARLVQALSDLDPEVARTASVLLSVVNAPGIQERLNDLARTGTARERAYATLALVDIHRQTGQNPFEPDTVQHMTMRRGLLHPEKLTRAAAAVGLAYGALDSPDPTVRAYLNREVVMALVDAVGGEHFRDFSSLSELVFASLRRLSGKDLPATAVAWATWWQTERDRFQARQPLSSVDPEEITLSYVRYDMVEADGRRRSATFRPERGGLEAGDMILAEEVFDGLVSSLKEAGFFNAEGPRRARNDEHLLITAGILNQARSMAVPATEDRYALLRMLFLALEEANRWQRYRDRDVDRDAKAWWRRNAQLMAEASPDERRVLLRSSIVYAFDDLATDDDKAAALDELEDLVRVDPVNGALDATEARMLVQAATSGPSFGDLESRAVRFALQQESAARVEDELIEALASRREPAARTLLARLLMAGDTATIVDAFSDPRPPMRAAGARAATLLLTARAGDPAELKRLDDALRHGLEVLIRDPDPEVAVPALVAVEKLGATDVVARLKAIYEGGNLGVRITVAEALGQIDPLESYPMFSLLLADERGAAAAPLRSALLEALGASRHENAVRMLGFYLLNDPDPGVQAAAGDALVAVGGDDARFTLIRALTEGQPNAERRARLLTILGRFDGEVVIEVLTSYLEDGDVRVAQAAAMALGEHNVADAVPYLLQIVRGGDAARAQEAVRALENVTSLTFDVAGHELLAEQYERWYQTARATASGIPDRFWFRVALRERGYDVGPLGPYVAGEPDPVAVPVLIRALRDDSPILRRNAALALERVTGFSLGEVTRTTSKREAERIAEQWARWWDRVRGPNGGR